MECKRVKIIPKPNLDGNQSTVNDLNESINYESSVLDIESLSQKISEQPKIISKSIQDTSTGISHSRTNDFSKNKFDKIGINITINSI